MNSPVPALNAIDRADAPDRIAETAPEPCVLDWTCNRCGCRLLLRMRTRHPGGCGSCGWPQLEPSAPRGR